MILAFLKKKKKKKEGSNPSVSALQIYYFIKSIKFHELKLAIKNIIKYLQTNRKFPTPKVQFLALSPINSADNPSKLQRNKD
jgi:hypothetical protein